MHFLTNWKDPLSYIFRLIKSGTLLFTDAFWTKLEFPTFYLTVHFGSISKDENGFAKTQLRVIFVLIKNSLFKGAFSDIKSDPLFI